MLTTQISLLKHMQSGDESAWSRFDGIYRPLLTRFAQNRGLVAAEVDDVVQDCMKSIFEHLRSYDPQKGRFKTWLRAMVNNRISNLRVKKAARPADSGAFERPQEREPTPEDAFEELWEREHLRHALELLRRETDAAAFGAFCDHVIEERSVEATCEKWNIAPNNLYKIKWRLTQKLRELKTELLQEME